MARQSLIPGRVKNTGIDLLLAGVIFGGAIIGLEYANKKFGILNKFVAGANALGTAVGQAVGQGVAAIPSNIGTGALSVFSPTGDQNSAVRAALGLPADTQGCLTIPFTNIPLPGQNCSNAVNQANNSLPATASGAQGGVEPNKQATSNTAGGVSVDITRTSPRSPTTNPTQPGSNLTPSTTTPRSQTITTIKPTTSRPSVGQITPARTVTTNTEVRGLPLNQTLTNIVKAGGTVQSAVINTTTGGTREVAGSPGLLARLAANLKSG